MKATCKHCGATIERREVPPEARTWRGGRAVIWVDMTGSAKKTWGSADENHYHEPEEAD